MLATLLLTLSNPAAGCEPSELRVDTILPGDGATAPSDVLIRLELSGYSGSYKGGDFILSVGGEAVERTLSVHIREYGDSESDISVTISPDEELEIGDQVTVTWYGELEEEPWSSSFTIGSVEPLGEADAPVVERFRIRREKGGTGPCPIDGENRSTMIELTGQSDETGALEFYQVAKDWSGELPEQPFHVQLGVAGSQDLYWSYNEDYFLGRPTQDCLVVVQADASGQRSAPSEVACPRRKRGNCSVSNTWAGLGAMLAALALAMTRRRESELHHGLVRGSLQDPSQPHG